MLKIKQLLATLLVMLSVSVLSTTVFADNHGDKSATEALATDSEKKKKKGDEEPECE